MKNNKREDGSNPPFDVFAEFELETYKELLKDRTILYNGDINKSVIERIVLPITALSQKSIKPIKLLINSPGGDVESGQAVVDSILTSRAPVIGVALGEAMSMAFDILLACDKRVCYPNTVLLCHAGSTMMERQTLSQINTEAHQHEVLFKRWAIWYASRTKISEQEWMNLLNTGLNKYWHPEQALKDGIIQEIIQPATKSLKNLKKYKF